jgi:hypothetical protein
LEDRVGIRQVAPLLVGSQGKVNNTEDDDENKDEDGERRVYAKSVEDPSKILWRSSASPDNTTENVSNQLSHTIRLDGMLIRTDV